MPRPDEETKTYFRSILPEDPRIVVRSMFGHQAGFINGNMFTGIFGTQVFVRLPESERAELLAIEGATVFSPMEGRPMSEYVVFPDGWRNKPDDGRAWMARSLHWASGLPPKEKKPKKAK